MNKVTTSGDKIFWLLQIIFSFIITIGLFEYKQLILFPDFSLPQTYALIGILITTIWSWIDFTQIIYNTAYDRLDWRDMVRFLIDFTIVVVYAIMMFSIDLIIKQPNGYIFHFLISYPIMFFLYIISGITRRLKYGKSSSLQFLLITFLIVYLLAFIIYSYLYIPKRSLECIYLNIWSINAFLLIYIIYRILRRYFKRKLKKVDRIKLGVDIDGVIADQVTNLLPLINRQFNLSLEYNDITEWRKKIGNTDIAELIISIQRDSSFIIDLPIIKDSSKILNILKSEYEINLLTAREVITKNSTINWLNKMKIPYDNIYNLKEGDKSLIDVRILIDDYQNNIINYLKSKPKSIGILFRQPWNNDLSEIDVFMSKQRCFVANNWQDIPLILKTIKLIFYES